MNHRHYSDHIPREDEIRLLDAQIQEKRNEIREHIATCEEPRTAADAIIYLDEYRDLRRDLADLQDEIYEVENHEPASI